MTAQKTLDRGVGICLALRKVAFSAVVECPMAAIMGP